MIAISFVLFTALFFTAFVGATLSQLYKKQIAIAGRTATYFNIDEATMKKKKTVNNKEKPKLVVMEKYSNKAKKLIDEKTSASRKKELEQRLREAGYPLNMTATDFRFFQLLMGGVLFVSILLLLGRADSGFIVSLFLASIITALGMYYPSFYISTIIKKRRLMIQKKMPDFFDMVNLSIEAGMGLDASLLKVCQQMKGPLSEEFLQTLEEMKLGMSRREAFSNLRNRVPVHQFQSIITSLIQADMLGVGMSKVLRSLTERIREQRTQAAREQAMKAPVKMVFPMMLFIFPAIFIVMLGPLVIYLLEMVF